MTDGTAILEGGLADRSTWRTDNCPVGKSLELIGTRSAMLIMREACYGTTRFDDFAARVGITEAVAAARLRELTEAGLLERRPYREPGQRTRLEYWLTDKGRELTPVVLGLFEWGAKHLSPGGKAPLDLRHADCGAAVHVSVSCAQGHPVPLHELTVAPVRRTAPDADRQRPPAPRRARPRTRPAL